MTGISRLLDDLVTVLLLVLAAGIAIVLGMSMPTVGVYVLRSSLVAPALIEVGIPDLAAHLFVLYLGMMSMTTHLRPSLRKKA